MNAASRKDSDASSWKDLYQAAIYEPDLKKLPERIAEAETALVIRARELLYASEDDGEEQESVNDAMYILHALSRSLGRSSTANRSIAA
jgi:hypothetical protein